MQNIDLDLDFRKLYKNQEFSLSFQRRRRRRLVFNEDEDVVHSSERLIKDFYSRTNIRFLSKHREINFNGGFKICKRGEGHSVAI